MRKNIKNTIVGLFIIIGIALGVFMYTWFSGRLVLRNTYDIIVYFTDVRGLRVGDPVMVFGLEQGRVTSLKVDGNAVKTTLAIDRSITMSKDSKISIRSMSLVSADKFVKVEPGTSEETATTFTGVQGAFDLESMGPKIDSLFSSLENLHIGDVVEIARDLSQDISKSLARLVSLMKQPTAKMEEVIEKTEEVVIQLDSLTDLMGSDGTVGKLLTSDDLYQELRETNTALKDLLVDIKENPKRYINVKVF